jgi:hypothetical protein
VSGAGAHIAEVLAEVADFAQVLARCEPYPVQAFQSLSGLLQDEMSWASRQSQTRDPVLVGYALKVEAAWNAVREGSPSNPADVNRLQAALLELLVFGPAVGSITATPIPE